MVGGCGQQVDRGQRAELGWPALGSTHVQSALAHPCLGQDLGWLEEHGSGPSVFLGAGLFLAGDNPGRPGGLAAECSLRSRALWGSPGCQSFFR